MTALLTLAKLIWLTLAIVVGFGCLMLTVVATFTMITEAWVKTVNQRDQDE